jgi:hypothetical protein
MTGSKKARERIRGSGGALEEPSHTTEAGLQKSGLNQRKGGRRGRTTCEPVVGPER